MFPPIPQKGKFPQNTKITRKIDETRAGRDAREGGTHLVLQPSTEIMVTVRLKQGLAWWFILQILLPFTAPLQTLDIHDFLGTRSHHHAPASPESSTTPTMSEDGVADVAAMREPATPGESVSAVVVNTVAIERPLASAFSLIPSPHVQRSILRL
jgi:hypothetical protein